VPSLVDMIAKDLWQWWNKLTRLLELWILGKRCQVLLMWLLKDLGQFWN